MLYAFILGKNKELSKEELACYFHSNDIDFKIEDEGSDFLIIDSDNIDAKMISYLGGTLKIGKIYPLDEIEKMNLGSLFGISLYDVPTSFRREIGMKIKRKMKERGIKAKFFQTRKSKLTAVEILKKNLVGKEILIMKSKKTYFAVTESVYDPFLYKDLDVGRPKHRGLYSMPIRLTNIMINLAKLKKGDKMLDPFCGYGTILQTGLMDGLDVYGSDIDEDCIMSSEENLKWLREKYKVKGDRFLKKIDVIDIDKEFEKEKFDAIVSESYLGPPLRKSVSDEEAENVISNLTVFYERAFEKLSAVLKKGGRMVIALPIIRTKKNIFKMNMKSENLRLLRKFEDIYPKHITGREIFVFEKTT